MTDAEQRYLIDARRIIDAAVINAQPRGHLAVTAPILFGRLFVIPGIVDYLQRYPDMEVSAVFLDRIVNLLEEGLDVGIRIGELPDSSMRAIRVGTIRRIVCASSEYLVKYSTPDKPWDLTNHLVVAASAITPVTEGSSTKGVLSALSHV